MKLLTKLAAAGMLSLGFIFLIISVSALPELQNKNNNSLQIQEAKETASAGIAFSVPLLAGGGYMLWGLRRKHRQILSDRLQSTFYHLIEQHQGRISVLLLAKEANITGQEAKEYLDAKAKEFNASFDLSSDGGIYYYFQI
ncbi:hypothetical protein NIES4101_55430 [Calothrix sp. NIES-4101]|nr:hypothetical protein NIES4101_55430 [Calothrix sp. NIES-4101]